MLYIDYRIAAAYTRGQGDSRSNMLSQEVLLSWEQAVSRYVPFLPPQWLPIGGNTAVDSFSRLNLELSVLGFVCATGPIFCRAVFHKQHQRGVFPSLGADCVRICLFTQQQTSLQGSIWLSGYPCWTGGCSSLFWILFNFNHVVPVLEVIVEVMAHIM